MAEEEESFENLDDLDWSDVEDEMKANKDEILSQAAEEGQGATGTTSSEASGGVDSKGVELKAGDLDINFLLDVNLSIKVEVGRTQLLIEEMLELEENIEIIKNSRIDRKQE